VTWRISDIMDAIAKDPRDTQQGFLAARLRDTIRRRRPSTATNVIANHFADITFVFGHGSIHAFRETYSLPPGWKAYDNKLADLLVEEARLRKIPESS
jgi:hypothetical protein